MSSIESVLNKILLNGSPKTFPFPVGLRAVRPAVAVFDGHSGNRRSKRCPLLPVFGRRAAAELRPAVGDHGLNFRTVLPFEDIKCFQGNKHHGKGLFVFEYLHPGRATVTVNRPGQVIGALRMGESDALRQLMTVSVN
jgi:hypothetical protein